MLDEIPKLFGKGFVIGYLLPVLIVMIYLVQVADFDPLGLGPDVSFDAEKLGKVSLSLILLSFFMLFLNRPIVRFLEGYGRFNPLQILMKRSLARYDKFYTPIAAEWYDLEAKWKQNNDARPSAMLAKRGARVTASWPPKREHVLPTRFGNVYRAFESYPSVMYGIDAVVFWPRLSAILPIDAQDLLQDSRARLDFHVTLLATCLTSAAMVIADNGIENWPSHVVVAPLLIGGAVLWLRLPRAAAAWGTRFSAMFDLYRRPLATSMGFDLPRTAQEERQMWYDLSRALLYQRPYTMDCLDPCRTVRPESQGTAHN
ncbi:hypothetical protein [Blastomonas aquatica]|uniref:hypothetical protein n=1 Tax=Blastomonas aquatica TaxID=1510276 RepID=UPI0016665B19|nr:hypothetical protein [Blastomonas aquatica]